MSDIRVIVDQRELNTKVLIDQSAPNVLVKVSTGIQGEDGEGVPVGGTTGQVLAKNSATNYDTEWVDVTAGETSPVYMLTGSNSDISGYESAVALSSYTAGTLATVSQTVTTSETLLEEFATNLGFPNTTALPIGLFSFHWETQKSSGPRFYYSYAKLFKRSAGGTETLLLTSDNSSQVSANTVQQVDVNAFSASIIPLLATDRIVVKVYARTVTGSDTITLRWDDNTDSRFQLAGSPLTYIPENVANKAVNFFTVNDTLYPTVAAVNNQLASYAVNTLSNLVTTSINAGLFPDTDQTYSIGASGLNWNDIQAVSLSYNGDAAQINLQNKIIYDAAGNTNYDWPSRAFYDSAVETSIDYEQRQLLDSTSNGALFWGSRELKDAANNQSLNWQTRLLYDDGSFVAMNWVDRELYDSAGALNLSWSQAGNITAAGYYTASVGNLSLNQSSTPATPAVNYLAYYSNNLGYPTWADASNRRFSFSLNSLVAATPREYTMPNADGTIALQSYVTSGFLPITNPTASGTLTVPTIRAATTASANLTLQSTSNATKGNILFGTSAYDEVNNRLGIRLTAPTSTIHAVTNSIGVTYSVANGLHLENTTASSSGNPQYSPVLTLSGTGFQGAASGLSRFSIDVVTTSGSSYASTLRFQSNTNGSLATPFQLTQNGSLTISNAMSAFSYTGNTTYTGGTAGNNATSGATNIFTTSQTVNPTSGTLTWTGVNIAPTINQTGGANGITRGLYINPTLTAAADFRAIETTGGKVVFAATNTTAGTTGNVTINRTSGTCNFAAAASSLVVTNNLVTTASIVFAVVRTNDTTATIKNVVPAAGSFTIRLEVAATAETSVGFFVIN